MSVMEKNSKQSENGCDDVLLNDICDNHDEIECELKGAVGSADLKISKSALLSLNHHNLSNTKPIYTE